MTGDINIVQHYTYISIMLHTLDSVHENIPVKVFGQPWKPKRVIRFKYVLLYTEALQIDTCYNNNLFVIKLSTSCKRRSPNNVILRAAFNSLYLKPHDKLAIKICALE